MNARLLRLASALLLPLVSLFTPVRGSTASDTEPIVTIGLFWGQSVRALDLNCPGGFRLRGERLGSPLKAYARGTDVMLSDGRDFHRLLPRLSLTSAKNNDILLTTAAGNRRLVVGTVELETAGGKLRVVNRMTEEIYVLGVVEPELGSLNFPAESLKAQIVASRSYVLALHHRHWKDGYDFCDSAHCQAFRGSGGLHPALLAAGAAVHGEYLSYGGRPAAAFYHDSCGGMTTAASMVWPVTLPYLRPVKDGAPEAYCRYAPRAHWRFQTKSVALRRCLLRAGWLRRGATLRGISVVALDESGRAKTILIQSDRSLRVPAQRFRWVVNRSMGSEVLPSTAFAISRGRQGYVIAGRGWGHGVGLCQWGAIQMAREGRGYRQILQHYYPGTGLTRLPLPLYAGTPKPRA
jgi:stage II sporulation protein D